MRAVLQGVWEGGWAERTQLPEPPGPHGCPPFPLINSPCSVSPPKLPSRHIHSLGIQGKVYKAPGKVGKPSRCIYSQHPENTMVIRYHGRGRAGARSSRTFSKRLWVSRDHSAQTPKHEAEATAIFTSPGALSLQSWALEAQLP